MKQNENQELIITVLELQKQNQAILSTLETLSKKVENPIDCPEIRKDWIPRKEVMNFLGYGDTQISYITKKYNITTSEVNKRKFYSTASLLQVLENNKH